MSLRTLLRHLNEPLWAMYVGLSLVTYAIGNSLVNTAPWNPHTAHSERGFFAHCQVPLVYKFCLSNCCMKLDMPKISRGIPAWGVRETCATALDIHLSTMYRWWNRRQATATTADRLRVPSWSLTPARPVVISRRCTLLAKP